MTTSLQDPQIREQEEWSPRITLFRAAYLAAQVRPMGERSLLQKV
jgi:hypothetical protein